MANRVEDIKIWPSKMKVINNSIWFVHGKINALFKYCFDDDELYYVGSVPGVSPMGEYPIFSDIVLAGDNLYLIPLWGEKIGIYNVNSNEFSTIGLPNWTNRQPKYSMAFDYEGFIYCFPYYSSFGGIKISMNDSKVSDINNIMKFEKSVFDTGHRVSDSLIMTVFYGEKKFLLFDLESERMEVVELPWMNGEGLNSGFSMNGDIYLHQRNDNRIFKVSKDGKSVIDEIKVKKANSSIISGGNRSIIIDSFDRDGVEIYDTFTGVIKDFCCDLSIDKGEFTYDYSVGAMVSDNENEYYYNRSSNTLYRVSTGEMRKPSITEEDLKRLQTFIGTTKSDLYYETALFGLEEFVNCL